MKTLEKNKIKKNNYFMPIKTRHKRTKKIGDILKILGLDKIGNQKSDLSINHDNILYK